jgi:hypothetical protein
VLLAEWVDCEVSTLAHLFLISKDFFPSFLFLNLMMNSRSHTMRTSAGAAIGIVAKLVNVHASLSIGIVAGDIVVDGGRGGFGLLHKGHGACDL